MHWIFAHLIGDYIFQTDWMAKNKKTSSFACLVHVATYMIPFTVCGLDWWQWCLIAIQHFVQDRTQIVPWIMKMTGKKSDGFAGPPFAPWSMVLTDNILHILWMAAVVAKFHLN